MAMLRIILVSLCFTVIASQRGHNIRNWNNIWTTMTPPTSPKPTHARRLSVLDTIRAAAEASKRLYSSSVGYTEKVVKPIRIINKSSYPSHEAGRQPSARGYVRDTVLNRAQERTHAHYAEPQVAKPTAETRFRGQILNSNNNNNMWDRAATSKPVSSRYGLVSASLNNAKPKTDNKRWRPEFSLNDGRSRVQSRPQTNNWGSNPNTMPDIIARDLSSSSNRRVQPSVRGKAESILVEESSMFDTGAGSHHSPNAASRYDIHGSAGKDPIALYAYDGHGHSTQQWAAAPSAAAPSAVAPSAVEPSAVAHRAATQPPSYGAATAHSQHLVTHGPRYGISTPRNRYSDARKTTEEQRFKVLPNGSIVDYGLHPRPRKPKISRAALVTRATKPPRLFSTAVMSKNQTKPTVMALTTARVHYTKLPSTTRLASAMAAAYPTTLQQVVRTSLAPSRAPTPAATNAFTKSPRLSTKQQYVSPSGGISVVDMYNFTTDFWNSSSTFVTNDHYNNFYDNTTLPPAVKHVPATPRPVTHSQLPATPAPLTAAPSAHPAPQPAAPSAQPAAPSPHPASSSAAHPAAPAAHPAAPSAHPATTTSLRATTLPPTIRTTRPRAQRHQDDYWLKQGGIPVNITYANDNHVCPTGRARWQDFTVYLETKARLCMVQITFNARYKREPIYHNTWMGNSVEWIYRTVYDPEVKFIDMSRVHY